MAWNWRGQRATGSKQQQQQQQQVEIESMAIPRQMGREYYVVYVASEHSHTHTQTHSSSSSSTPFCCLSTHLDIYAVMYFSSQWLLIGRITVNDRNALAGRRNAEATTALSRTLILFFHCCDCDRCCGSCITCSGSGSGSSSSGRPRRSCSSCCCLWCRCYCCCGSVAHF